MPRIQPATHLLFLVAATGLMAATGLCLAQEPSRVAETGARILMDAGHHNVFNAESRASMSRFLEEAGFQVQEYDGLLSAEALADTRILIIGAPLSSRNALPAEWTQEIFDQTWRLPNPSAFSEDEIRSIVAWVEAGGSLLLVTDHMPIAGATQDLARSFGIEVSNGFAVDAESLTDLTASSVAGAGSIVFDRADGSLRAQEVTDGRGPDERVERIAMYSGSAFRLPEAGISLADFGPSFVSLLPEVSWQFSDDTPRELIAGWSQGGLLEFDRGRVAMFGELGILATPESIAGNGEQNDPQEQNPRLLLNVLNWLSAPSE